MPPQFRYGSREVGIKGKETQSGNLAQVGKAGRRQWQPRLRPESQPQVDLDARENGVKPELHGCSMQPARAVAVALAVRLVLPHNLSFEFGVRPFQKDVGIVRHAHQMLAQKMQASALL